MTERSATSAIYATPVHARSDWARRMLGRDWKVGYLFVLPMVVIMAGLIFWPFLSAIYTSTT